MSEYSTRSFFRLASRRSKILLTCFAAALLIAAVSLIIIYGHKDNAIDQPNVSQLADNSFRPTPTQWDGLKIEPVSEMVFHSQQATDGKIAIDEDSTTPVFSPYSGRVSKLFAKAGDAVVKGDPLFTIEATEYIQAQNDLITASASLNTAKAELKMAVLTEKRQHELFDIDAGALKTWQQSQADLATAQASLRSDEIAYAEARNHLKIFGKSDADIDSLEKTPDARTLNADTIVTAPRDGTVIQRQIGLGQYIQAGATNPVYTIGDLSTVWLVANVRETDAGLMRVGSPVEVQILAFPGRVYRAHLTFVAATVDATTHRLPVRAEVENPDGSLKPEMFAGFNIATGDDRQAIAVPDKAVVYEGTAAHVWIAQDDKTVVLKTIEVGRTNNGWVEVLNGLSAKDKIVTSGALFIDRAVAGD
jgi:cobalt-zinc-cadmium efflux system membrane fusion protein